MLQNIQVSTTVKFMAQLCYTGVAEARLFLLVLYMGHVYRDGVNQCSIKHQELPPKI